MMDDKFTSLMQSIAPTRETSANVRYGDKITATGEDEFVFKHPGTEPLKTAVGAELHRMQKTPDHWERLARSKNYIAEPFLRPIKVTHPDLRVIFEGWGEHKVEALHDLIPRLSTDGIIELCLYLSLEAEWNGRDTWRMIEDAILRELHLFDLRQTCQLQWAITQLRPRHCSVRLLDLFQ